MDPRRQLKLELALLVVLSLLLVISLIGIPTSRSSQRLVLKQTGLYNGFLEQSNIVECTILESNNRSSYELDIVIKNEQGLEIASGTQLLPALGTTNFILNDLAEIKDSYGSYEITARAIRADSGAQLKCQTVFYRFKQEGSDKQIDYAFALSSGEELNGKSYGIYNSIDPQNLNLPVYNWLTFYNSSDRPFSALLKLYTLSGAEDQTFEIGPINPGIRRDFPLGHNFPGNSLVAGSSNQQNIGLYEIAPRNNRQNYVAFITRYGRDLTNNFNFAFPLRALRGGCNYEPIAASTFGPALNWGEVANLGKDPANVLIEITYRDPSGLKTDSLRRTISPHSQFHVPLHDYLGKDNVGSFQVRCLNPSDQLLVQNVFYGQKSSGTRELEWAYASQGFGISGNPSRKLNSIFNTFISDNWLKVFDTATSSRNFGLSLFANDGSEISTRFSSFRVSGSRDIPIHQDTGPEQLGHLELLGDSSFAAAAIRVYPKVSGEIGYIMNQPIFASSKDRDGDGSNDELDLCPNDTNKIRPGTCGCGNPDRDQDGNGTIDCEDTCPNDPEKAAPGICGCGVSDADSDRDRTPDCNDSCPNDRNKIAPGVCGCGTSEIDSDRDGTADCRDSCPSDRTKITAGICGCGIPDSDTDNDGTANCLDQCPDDSNKTAPELCGCGNLDRDLDGNGVPDCNDECINDANKDEPGVCGCGVPDTDSDRDGTADCLDSCPNDINKSAIGICGCLIPDTDTNNNSVIDCLENTARTNEIIAPSGVFVSLLSLSEAKITWNDNSYNEDSFLLERKTNDGQFTQIATIPANNKQYINPGLTAGQNYSYRLRAKKGNSFSDYSREMEIRASEFHLDREVICQRFTSGETLPANYKIFTGKGDGVTDNYRFFRNSRTFANRLGTSDPKDNPMFLIIPEGRYLVNQYLGKPQANGQPAIAHIQFSPLSYARILGCGQVKIETDGNFTRTVSNTSVDGMQVFRFKDSNNFTIEGIELDGNVDHAARESEIYDGSGVGLMFIGCSNYLVKDMNIHHFSTDGIYLGQGRGSSTVPNLRAADRQARIHNVRSTNNARQGMTIVQIRDVWVSSSVFGDTGRTGSARYAALDPSAGIDIEPNYFTLSRDPNDASTASYPDIRVDVLTGDILIENSNFIGNIGAQLTSSLGRASNPITGESAPWPLPRIENLMIRHSNFIASSDSTPGVVNLPVKNGVMEHSFVDARATANGKINISLHTGSNSGGPNANDRLIQTTVRSSTILSNEEAFFANWGKHPINIENNHIQGTITVYSPDVLPENPGVKRVANNNFYAPRGFIEQATDIGFPLMRTWVTEMENNKYCLADESSTPRCEDQLPTGSAHLHLNYGSRTRVTNEQFLSACFIRPSPNFSSCTTSPYLFSR